MLRPHRFVVGTAVFLLTAACSHGPTPIEPTADPSATSTARPPAKPKVPVMPAIARRHDATGAANFVLYWVKVSNYAATTGDTARLREISAPDCEGCNRYINLYEKTYAAGGRITGGSRTLTTVLHSSGHNEELFDCKVHSAPGTFQEAAGQKSETTPAETNELTYATRLTGSSWHMTQVGLTR